MSKNRSLDELLPKREFVNRHIGPSEADIEQMLDLLGFGSLDALMDDTVPENIRHRVPLDLPSPAAEHEIVDELYKVARHNRVFRPYIGMGYYDCLTPAVILRNILENPGWYTQYTPYQAEISQGRLEALLNFQTMVADLTGLPLSNSSLLDEATAAAEAMSMCFAVHRGKKRARTCRGPAPVESKRPDPSGQRGRRAAGTNRRIHPGEGNHPGGGCYPEMGIGME